MTIVVQDEPHSSARPTSPWLQVVLACPSESLNIASGGVVHLLSSSGLGIVDTYLTE